MSTTTLKLSDELKQCAVSVAQKQGVSPHAFMVQAIDQAATQAESRVIFLTDALAEREKILKTGKGYDADEVHAYIQTRALGEKSSKPKEKSWRG